MKSCIQVMGPSRWDRRLLQLAVVVESLQTAEHLLTAAAYEFSDLMRTQMAMPIHHAKNLRVARGHSIGAALKS